jgi:hypothetical protein
MALSGPQACAASIVVPRRAFLPGKAGVPLIADCAPAFSASLRSPFTPPRAPDNTCPANPGARALWIASEPCWWLFAVAA